MSATLDFPSPATLGQVYEKWQFNGRAWDPLPQTPYVPLAGNVAMTGPIYYTGPFVLGTSLVNKDYVDQAVSQLQVFEGAWDAATNTPDLTLVAVPTNGSYYIASSAGTAPAALPGIGGQTVRPGDMVVWQTGPPAEWAIIPGAGMTQAEADVRYLQLAGGSLTGTLTLAGNAAAAPGGNLQPVPLQQLNTALADYVLKAGDTMSGALAITGATGNLSVAGTSTLTGNSSVGGTLGVTGNATLTAQLFARGYAQVGTPTGTAITAVGSVNAQNGYYVNGVNLTTTFVSFAAGAANANRVLETNAAGQIVFVDPTDPLIPDIFVKVIQGTTAAQAVPYITTSQNPQASPFIVQALQGTSFNQGLRLNRAAGGAAHDWCGIIVGGATNSVQGVQASGDGAFTQPNLSTLAWVNARSTWWVASNQQGDFEIDQASPTRGSQGGAMTTATTEPSGSTGFYIRRSDNQAYLMGIKLNRTGLSNLPDTFYTPPTVLNYRNKLTASTGYTIHSSTRFYSDGITVKYAITLSVPAGGITQGTSIMSGVPVGLRPSETTYRPATLYTIISSVATAYSGGDIAFNTNGTIMVDSAFPLGTGTTGYLFFNGEYYVAAREPAAAP